MLWTSLKCICDNSATSNKSSLLIFLGLRLNLTLSQQVCFPASFSPSHKVSLNTSAMEKRHNAAEHREVLGCLLQRRHHYYLDSNQQMRHIMRTKVSEVSFLLELCQFMNRMGWMETCRFPKRINKIYFSLFLVSIFVVLWLRCSLCSSSHPVDGKQVRTDILYDCKVLWEWWKVDKDKAFFRIKLFLQSSCLLATTSSHLSWWHLIIQ